MTSSGKSSRKAGKPTSGRGRRQEGYALVSVLMLTTMVVLTAGMVLVPSLMGRSASAYSGAGLTATHATEAGIDYALAALNTTIPTGATSSLAALPAPFVQGTGGAAGTWTYSDPGNGHFFRDVIGSVPTLTIRIPANVPIAGGPGVAGDYRIIRSETTVRGAKKRMEAIALLLRNVVQAPISPFTRAITARGTIDPNGNNGTLRTDSYDSTLGPYGGGNLGTNGGVHTNGSIIGGGVYRGNVSAVGTIDTGLSVQGAGNTVRPNADPEDIADPPPLPTATQTVAVNPPQTLTPAAGAVVNLGAVSLSGNSSKVLTLNAGTYVMSSLSTTGNASIRIGTGPVTIFVTGDIDVQGNGIVNASALPPNLRLIETNPSASVSLAGNGNFYGVMQAPNNTVTLGGNGEFFGALVADDFAFNGSNSIVHYDDAVGRAFSSIATQNRPAEWRAQAINVLDRGNP